jgi:phosphonate transport system substrate-binding protein
MNRRRFVRAVTAALLIPAFSTGRAQSHKKQLTVGIFPRRNVSMTHALFNPMVQYLSERLERPVHLETAKDFTQFWENLRNRQYDIVHFNQYHYILSHELYGYQAIARNNEFGSSLIAGAIVVRKDKGYKSLQDLRGKALLFGGGPRAMQSYIAPRWLLQKAGLGNGDFEERIALNPPNAVISTFLGRADAAGCGDVSIRLDVVKNAIDVTQLAYLAKTESMAQLPWAVHPRLSADEVQAIKEILYHLHDSSVGQKLLDNAKLSGLDATKDSDYDPHRKIIRDVYGDDLGMSKYGIT